MNVLFEEDGAFRAGSILADNTTSLQIELASGKRSKVKAANVVLRYATPAAGDLLHRAEADAEDIDIDFLWEVSGDAEFSFEDLAVDYHGTKPDAVQTIGLVVPKREPMTPTTAALVEEAKRLAPTLKD